MEKNKLYNVSEKLYESNNLKDLKQLVNMIKEKYSNKTAFKIRNKNNEVTEITFKTFVEDIEALGTALISIGLKEKRIAVISENRYEWCVTYLSTVTGVGVSVPLDRSLPENEIIDLINRSEVEAVFFSEKYNPVMEKIIANKDTKVKFFISMDLEEKTETMYSQKELIKLGKELISNGARTFIDTEVDNKVMTVMLFTSGTTSKSKAVMLSHENIANNINDITNLFDIQVGDTLLSFLPLHHTFECTVGFLYAISTGATIAFCRGIRYIAEDIKLNKISVMISVPLLFESLYKQIMKTIEKSGKMKKFQIGLKISGILRKFGIDKRRELFKEIHQNLGGNLRLFVAGAAAFDPIIEKNLNNIGIDTYQGYGATENSPVIAAEHKTCTRPGSVGKLLPSVEGKVIDVDEKGIGEFIVKGPSVMLGYYNNEEATKDTLKDGWLYTGDLGYFDKDGYMFITGRKKNVIVLKNGKNVYPEEIESLINKISGVKECFVYGKPEKDDPIDLKLAVKVVYDEEYMKNELKLNDEKEIKDAIWKEIKEINKTMPTYKYIKELTITLNEFEKTTTQKIKRFEEIKKV